MHLFPTLKGSKVAKMDTHDGKRLGHFFIGACKSRITTSGSRAIQSEQVTRSSSPPMHHLPASLVAMNIYRLGYGNFQCKSFQGCTDRHTHTRGPNWLPKLVTTRHAFWRERTKLARVTSRRLRLSRRQVPLASHSCTRPHASVSRCFGRSSSASHLFATFLDQ